MIPIVREMIARHPGTISLGQGVVHYGPPAEVKEAVGEFFRAGQAANLYGPVGGLDPLVEMLAAKLREENGIEVGHECRVVVTAGGNMAFFNAVLAVCDVGDEVIVLSPYYFNHEMAVTIASARPIVVATDEQYQPRVDAIAAAITPRTRAVVTVSPNNPTGAAYPEPVLRDINALCAARGVYHIHDEAYEYFTYGDASHFSPGSIPGASADHTISLFSLSKSYGFASWRIGYMVVPAKLLPAVQKVQDTNLISPPVISQYAAMGALRAGADYCRERVRGLADVRRLVLDHLAELGDIVTVPRAQGAMYFLVKVQTERRDMELVEALIRDFRVAVMPGSTFGIDGGCYLRVSYGALEQPTVAEGVSRLARGLRVLA